MSFSSRRFWRSCLVVLADSTCFVAKSPPALAETMFECVARFWGIGCSLACSFLQSRTRVCRASKHWGFLRTRDLKECMVFSRNHWSSLERSWYSGRIGDSGCPWRVPAHYSSGYFELESQRVAPPINFFLYSFFFFLLFGFVNGWRPFLNILFLRLAGHEFWQGGVFFF